MHPLQHKQDGGYHSVLLKQLYRNALFCRLHMPYRFTAYIQVDLYHLKEVTRVSGLDDAELRAFETTASSSSGQSYHLLSNDAILQASQSTRVSSMDVFATIRLSRDSKFNLRPKEDNANEQSSQYASSMGSLMAAANSSASGDLHATSRVHLDGTCVSPCHKAEPSRGPIVTRDSDSGPQSGGGGGGASVCMYSRCGKSANYIQAYSDYSWREQALFRYALPEGIVSVGNEADSSNGPGLNVHENFLACPDAVLVSVYERSFFSDNKLGDLLLSLSELSEKRWVPINCINDIVIECLYAFGSVK